MVALGDEFNVHHFMSWTLQFFFWVIEFEENGKSIHVGSRIPLKKSVVGCRGKGAKTQPAPILLLPRGIHGSQDLCNPYFYEQT
jgi:hypothetical protein